MRLEMLLWLAAGSLAVAAFTFSYLLLDLGATAALRLWRLRGFRGRLERVMAAPPAADIIGERAALGLDAVDWDMWRILCAAGGVLVAWLIFSETSPVYALSGLAAGFLPRLIMGIRAEQARWRNMQEIRNFITALRLAVSLGQTLTQALQRIAAQPGEGIFWQRLRHHVRTRLMTAPEEVIAALAADFRSRELTSLLHRVEAARRGGLGMGEALRTAAEGIEAEMTEAAMLAVEEAPARLILPMLVGLFPTIIVLLVYPLAAIFAAGF